MEERIRRYLDQLFKNAPNSTKALELKEELTVNMLEHCRDLQETGMSDEDAFQNAVRSLGNVSELFADLKDDGEESRWREELCREDRKRYARLQAAATGMYIFAAAVFLAITGLEGMFGGYSLSGTVGIVVLLILVGIAVMIQVYAVKAYSPRERNMSGKADSVVEEFREWQYEKGRDKEIRNAANTILWMAVLVVYFLISFFTLRWDVSWIVFLVGVCLQAILNLVFSMHSVKDSD